MRVLDSVGEGRSGSTIPSEKLQFQIFTIKFELIPENKVWGTGVLTTPPWPRQRRTLKEGGGGWLGGSYGRHDAIYEEEDGMGIEIR
eukprot:329925-Hanusia_phi.AAC.1